MVTLWNVGCSVLHRPLKEGESPQNVILGPLVAGRNSFCELSLGTSVQKQLLRLCLASDVFVLPPPANSAKTMKWSWSILLILDVIVFVASFNYFFNQEDSKNSNGILQ